MMSTQKQFWKIIRDCTERYSRSTVGKVGSLLVSHERVFQIEKIIDTNPTEQELLSMLNKEFPTAE